MSNYSSIPLVETFLQRALTTSEKAALGGYILAAIDKIIDRTLNTTFADVVASTRYFDGGGRSVDIDPVQDVSRVVALNNDGTEAYLYDDLTLYILEPVNESVKRELRPRGNFHFPHGGKRIAVTGRFTEYDTTAGVPSDIELVATRMAGAILNAGKISGQGGNIQMEDLEGHQVRYDITGVALKTLMNDDPILQSVLGARREIFVGDPDDDRFMDDTDW